MQQRLSYLLILLSILHSACGLYFLMGESERRCFIRETPDDTTVTVKYKAELWDPHSHGLSPFSPGFGMHWVVRDVNKKVILFRTYNSEDRFSFTTYWPGDHFICLQSNSNASSKDSQLRVHLDIRAGEHTVDYVNVMQKEKLDQMQLKVRQILNQAEQISKEQNYQRFLESQFRRTANDIYSNVFWWTLVQGIILVFIFAHMIHNLRKLSFLYKAFCLVLNEEKVARFRTAEAYNALMEIIGPGGQGVSSKAISQWVAQIPCPESTDENEPMNINEMLLGKVKEFAGKFLNKQVQTTAESPKDRYYASNVNLMSLLAGTERDRSGHLTGNTFLLVCECEDCKCEGSKSNGESTKS